MKHYNQNSNLGFTANYVVVAMRMPMSFTAWMGADKHRTVGFGGGVSN